MHQWDLSVFSVTPAASLLSRCVSRGALSQVDSFPPECNQWRAGRSARGRLHHLEYLNRHNHEEIDHASSRQNPAFSPHLKEAEQRISAQRQLEELQLQVELLQLERESADVSHTFHLTRRFQMLQMFCGHLQELLQDQSGLRQRLMKPLARTSLPVLAHLHRSVVEVVKMLLVFIETLEEKLDSARGGTRTRDRLTLLDTSLAQLLAQVAEVQSLSRQVLQWKEVGSSLQGDSSA